MSGYNIPCLECLACKGLWVMLGEQPADLEPSEQAKDAAESIAVASSLVLSGRESEVLGCIARGKSNKEIARLLGISDQTVKNHITSILRKLALNDRTQAVVYAIAQGWIKPQAITHRQPVEAV